MTPIAWAKSLTDDPEAISILSAAIAAYEGLTDRWTHDELHAATLGVAEGVGRKLGKAQAPIRVAVTGKRVGLPLFESLEVLGPDRTLDRLRAAVRRVESGRS